MKRLLRIGQHYDKKKEALTKAEASCKRIYKIGKTTGVSEEQVEASHGNHGKMNEFYFDRLAVIKEIKRIIQESGAPPHVSTIWQQSYGSTIWQQQKSLMAKKMKDVDKLNTIFPQFEEIRQTLYKERSSKFPPKPSQLEDIVIEGEWALDDSDERFWLAHVKEENTEVGTILIFTTDSCLKVL